MNIFGFNFDKKHGVFLAVFAIAALVAQQVNFSAMVMPLGVKESPFFTLFQFFGPVAGAFLGVAGIAVILAAELANTAISVLVLNKAVGAWTVLGLLPMLFAAWYFSQNKENTKSSVLIPLAAISLFVLHPVGAQVWYFAAMFWSIPIITKVFFAENLLAKSLGATMTAHAVGGSMWIWAFPTTAAYWNALIPVVAFERSMFAIGIALSFVAMTSILYYATLKSNWAKQFAHWMHLDAKYALFAR